jgi:biopolymer transport protein ExbB
MCFRRVCIVLCLLLVSFALTAAPGGDQTKGKSMLLYYFDKGGIFMWALLIFSLAGLAIVIERMIVISRVRRGSAEFEAALRTASGKGDLRRVRQVLEGDDSDTARILLAGLNSVKKGPERMERVIEATASLQVSIMERGLNILSSLAHLAPLVGFLGTVSGMITAFGKISEAESVSAKLVAGGIFEALITTAGGLIVAIPILVFHNYFVHRVDRFVTDVERLSLEMMENLGNKGKL